MKKLFFIAFLSGLFFNATAQRVTKNSLLPINHHKYSNASSLKKNLTKPNKMIWSNWQDNSWVVSDTNYYEYNGVGYVSKSTRHYIDGGIQIIMNNYDFRKFLGYIELYKINNNSNFDTTEILQFTTDSIGNYKYSTFKSFENNSEYKNKILITYGISNRIESFIIQDWNNEKADYESKEKLDIVYDANNHPSTITYSQFDSVTNQFKYKLRNSEIKWFTFIGNIIDYYFGNFYTDYQSDIKSYTIEEFDGINWVISGKANFTYDVEYNLTSELFLDYNGTTFDTTSFYKYDLTYNSNNELMESIFKFWNRNNKTFENAIKEVFTDYNLVSSINRKNVEDNTLSVYPNPANDQIAFSSDVILNATITITDLNGKIIAQKTMENGKTTFDKNQINPGLYIYNINIDNFKLKTGKIIIN